MRTEISEIVSTLLAESATGSEISIDRIGELVGVKPVTSQEIDEMIAWLEREGRIVGAVREPVNHETLRRVLQTARTLGTKLARRATMLEIAREAELPPSIVHAALLLGRVMGR